MALPFRDRVVQWAIYRQINPLLDKRYISTSYACRIGGGTQRAIHQLQQYLRHTPGRVYVLKLDVSKYFYRVDHEVLLNILQRIFKDHELLELLEKIKHKLHQKRYIRYMDDMAIVGNDKAALRAAWLSVGAFLRYNLHLQLNRKSGIESAKQGIDFCGYRVYTDHIKLRKKAAKKMKHRLKYLQKQFARGEIQTQDFQTTLVSYLGLLKHCDSYRLVEKMLEDFKLQRNRNKLQRNRK